MLGLLSFWVAAEIVYKNIFNVYFSISLLKLADQLMTFWKDTLGMIGKNILYILIVFMPFIGGFIVSKKIDFTKSNLKIQGIRLLIIIVIIIISFVILLKNAETVSKFINK